MYDVSCSENIQLNRYEYFIKNNSHYKVKVGDKYTNATEISAEEYNVKVAEWKQVFK